MLSRFLGVLVRGFEVKETLDLWTEQAGETLEAVGVIGVHFLLVMEWSLDMFISTLKGAMLSFGDSRRRKVLPDLRAQRD